MSSILTRGSMDVPVELRKARFFHNKECAWCGSQDMLELDRVEPFTWPPESIWKLSDWEFSKYIQKECQILCSPCYLRKKRIHRAIKEGKDLGLVLR